MATYDFAQDGVDPGQAQKRRQIAEAMMVPGAGQLASMAQIADAKWMFLVTAASGATLDTAIGDLVTAVCNQESWELHVLFEGTREWAWTCWDAEEPTIGMTASFWGPDASSPVLWAPVTVLCKRDPILVAGPYQIA